jgi:hypothetical protein
MSLEICKYHGECLSTFNNSIPSGTVYTVKKEEELNNLVNKSSRIASIGSYIAKTDFISTIDLNERNISFIYIKEGGGQYKHYIKSINCNNSEMTVSIINPTILGILNTCTFLGKLFVISTLKNFDVNQMKIKFENYDIGNLSEYREYQKSSENLSLYKDGKKRTSEELRDHLIEISQAQSLLYNNLIQRLEKPEIIIT